MGYVFALLLVASWLLGLGGCVTFLCDFDKSVEGVIGTILLVIAFTVTYLMIKHYNDDNNHKY